MAIVDRPTNMISSSEEEQKPVIAATEFAECLADPIVAERLEKAEAILAARQREEEPQV